MVNKYADLIPIFKLYSVIMTYFNQLKGKAALVGLMFLVGGGIYSFTAPLWGYLTDKKVCLQN